MVNFGFMNVEMVLKTKAASFKSCILVAVFLLQLSNPGKVFISWFRISKIQWSRIKLQIQKVIFLCLWFSVAGTETTANIKQYTTDETLAPTTKASKNVASDVSSGASGSDSDNITSVSSNGGNQTINYTITQPCCVSPNNTYHTSGASSKTSTITLSKTTIDDQPLGSNATDETTQASRNNRTIDIPGENMFARNYYNHNILLK